MNEDNTYESVWDAVADTVAEAEIFKARSTLLTAISRRLEVVGWSQKEIAKRLGLTRPRVEELVNQRIGRFTVEELIAISANLGIERGK